MTVWTKIAICLTAFCFSITFLQAQNGKKYWNEGELTWDDFKERTSSFGETSYLSYGLEYKRERRRSNDTVFVRVVAYAFVNTQESWIHPAYKNEQYLRYNQVIFNIVEVYKRELQQQLDKAYSPLQYDQLLHYWMGRCNETVSKFVRESNWGTRMDAIQGGEEKTWLSMRSYPVMDFPDFRLGKFGLGVHMGTGTSFYTATVQDFVVPRFVFNIGYYFMYTKYMLYVDVMYGSARMRDTFEHDVLLPEGQGLSSGFVNAALGYKLVEGRKFSLTPFAGYGLAQFSIPNHNIEEEKIYISNGNWMCGVNVDYNLRTRLVIGRSKYYKVQDVKNVFPVHTRLALHRAHFHPDFKGFVLNLTVGIGIGGQFIRVE